MAKQRQSQINAAVAYFRAGGDVSGSEWDEYRDYFVDKSTDGVTYQMGWAEFLAFAFSSPY